MRGILRYTVSVHRIRHNRIMTHTKQPFPENTRQNTSTCALPTCKRQSPAYVLTPPAKHLRLHVLQALLHSMTTHDTLYYKLAK